MTKKNSKIHTDYSDPYRPAVNIRAQIPLWMFNYLTKLYKEDVERFRRMSGARNPGALTPDTLSVFYKAVHHKLQTRFDKIENVTTFIRKSDLITWHLYQQYMKYNKKRYSQDSYTFSFNLDTVKALLMSIMLELEYMISHMEPSTGRIGLNRQPVPYLREYWSEYQKCAIAIK
jgi:hypothetical protein